MSEKLADRYGLDVKYGAGPDDVRKFLRNRAEDVAEIEGLLLRVGQVRDMWSGPEAALELEALDSDVRELHSNLMNSLREAIVTL